MTHEDCERPQGEEPDRQGYCVACKAKRTIRGVKRVERAGGPALEGSCEVCGSKIFVLGTGTNILADGTPLY